MDCNGKYSSLVGIIYIQRVKRMKYLGLRTAAIPKLDSVRPEQIVQVVYVDFLDEDLLCCTKCVQ